MSAMNYGLYIVSFPWIGLPRTTPVNYPSGYQYVCYYDDEYEVSGGFHFDDDSISGTVTGTIYPDVYSGISEDYYDSIASAYSGPSLAAILPRSIGLLKQR